MAMTPVVGNNECPPSRPMPSAPPPEAVLTPQELEEVFPDVFLRPSEPPTTEEDKVKSQIDISQDVHQRAREMIIQGFTKKPEQDAFTFKDSETQHDINGETPIWG